MEVVLERIGAVLAERRAELQPYQLAEYKAARNWLKRYRWQQTADNLEQVKGYLEAFFHLCNVADWESAYRVVMLPVAKAGDEELHRQLFSWGYYHEQRSIYEALRGTLSPEIDLICLEWIG